MNTHAQCFECGAPAEHDHHVVPRSLGGTKTIPLCERCHGLIHDKEFVGISALTKRASRVKRQRGERWGQIPYGYSVIDDGRRSKQNLPCGLAPNPDELAVIAEIKAMYDDGRGKTCRAIAADLQARGIPTKNGKPWRHSTVHHLATQPMRTYLAWQSIAPKQSTTSLGT